MHDFYAKLYSKQDIPDDLDEFLANLHILKVQDSFISFPYVSENDVLDAIKKLNAGKSPGPDGFTPDFFRLTAPFIVDLLAQSFNEIFDSKKLPYSLAQAIIVLFFKKGDDRDPANYRPISLTNFDYKILAYVLMDKIMPTLDKCIHPAQTAYMEGRFIGTNIRKVQDAMNHIASNLESDSVILFLDFCKAFDLILHDFMLKLMVEMNYPASIIEWICIIYRDSMAIVQYKGWFTAEFSIQQGVQQGCPLSCHLFNLVSQTTIYYLNQKGCFATLLHKENLDLSSLFADDVVLLIKRADLATVLQHLFHCG